MANTWTFQHEVVAAAPRAAAWRFWSDVRNWAFDPSIEWVTLDGPVRAGARGVTKTRGQEPTAWRVTEAEEGERAVVEVETPGAVSQFEMRFEALPERRTRLVQRVVTEGPGVEQFAEEMGESLARAMREGMAALAAKIEEAAGGVDDRGQG